MAVRVQTEDFNAGDEIKRLQATRKDIGAVVCFVGLVRDINGELLRCEFILHIVRRVVP